MTRSLTLEDLPLREDLIGQSPYGAPQLDVAHQLNVNENPYPPSDRVKKAMADAIAAEASRINRYPDREAIALRTDLADYLGFQLTNSNIWPANGSNEVMSHLLQAFGGPGRTLLGFTPTYSMYSEYARNTHTNYVECPRYDDYQLDADLVAEACDKYRPDMIVIANPNNPTGTQIPVSVIDQICAVTDAIVIVDEAYQEFTEVPEDSSLALLPKYPKLVVCRTMSKAFALAGGRVGYLAAAPAIVDACRIVRLPYHLSVQTQTLARVALANRYEMLNMVNQLRQDCQELQRWCRDHGFEVVPSQSNFFLFGKFADRHQVWQQLLDQSVLVRETGPAGFLRVCVGTKEANSAFKAALLEVKENLN